MLLKGEIAINRNEHIKLFLSELQQVPVLDPRPAGLRHGDHLMACNLLSQSAVDALVEKNFHEATANILALASSRKAMICSRATVGNPSRKSSMVCPLPNTR